LKKAICEWEQKYRHASYVPDDIILTPGVAGALSVLHYAVLDPYAGDEVCVLEPAHYLWTPRPVVERFNARIVPIRCNESDDWQPDIEQLRRSVNHRTKYIMMDYPCNPTGAVYSESNLAEIIHIADENDVMIVSDEMYGMITYDGLEVKSLAALAGDVPVIVANGMSKFFMRTGWRVGYLAFHDPAGRIADVRKTAKLFSSLYGHPWLRCSPIMYAAAKAYAGSMEGGFKFVEELHPIRDYVMKRFDEMEGLSCVKPRAAFYAFPRIEGIGNVWESDEEFLTELNKEEALMFEPGSFYGPSGFGHFRTLLTLDHELAKESLDRLERFLRRHM
jgi:aspartate/methionine/tyrosine aminotransferase